jgi:Fe-S cluster biogenesis protein NfuA
VSADAIPLDAILDRTEELLEAVDAMPEADRLTVIELLDTVDELHRLALVRLGQSLSPADVERLRDAHPAIAWLWEAYGVGLDARTVVERALDTIRPYLSSHGGEVEVLAVEGGRVTVRLGGACVGCSASAVTLQHGVEESLRAGYPDFRQLTVDEDVAVTHEPPGPTLLEIAWHPDASRTPRA